MSTIAPPKPARAHASYTSGSLTRSRDRTKYGLAMLFGVYLAVLSWTVLWKLEAPWIGHASERTLKLVPYLATEIAGVNQTREILLNIALFIPFGVYLRYFAPSWPTIGILSIIAGTSFSFETIQYLLAIGVADTADLLNNTLGGLIGIAICTVAMHIFRGHTGTILLRVMCIGTVGVLILMTAYTLGSQLHQMGPPVQFPYQL